MATLPKQLILVVATARLILSKRDRFCYVFNSPTDVPMLSGIKLPPDSSWDLQHVQAWHPVHRGWTKLLRRFRGGYLCHERAAYWPVTAMTCLYTSLRHHEKNSPQNASRISGRTGVPLSDSVDPQLTSFLDSFPKLTWICTPSGPAVLSPGRKVSRETIFFEFSMKYQLRAT